MHVAVYDWFFAQMQMFAGEGVPFYETQGKGMPNGGKGLPDMWLTMEADTAALQRLTIGRNAIYRESGTVSCVFLGKSGVGIRDCLVAAQRLADYVRDNVYQIELVEADGRGGTLRIENVSSPDPDPYEQGNWLLCSVMCAYTYDSVRGAA